MEDNLRWEQYQTTGMAVPNDQVMAWLDDLEAGKRSPTSFAIGSMRTGTWSSFASGTVASCESSGVRALLGEF